MHNARAVGPTMRAAGLFGLHDVRIIEVPYPGQPGPGEVLIKVAAVGICGSDHHYYNEGAIGSAIVDEGMIIGHEFSGWVAGLGSGVTNLEMGQLVAVEPAIPCGVCEFCLQGHPNICPDVLFCGSPNHVGAMAEAIVMPAENCFPLPDDLTPVEGAMLEPLGVAIHTVDLAHLRVGETVAVLGAGPIGLLTAAVARANGAGAVYMTEPVADRRAFALDYAADAVFDPASEDVVTAILDATEGRGVDVAFEAAGAAETPDQAARVTRPGGKVIVVGIPHDDTMTMSAGVVRRKGLTIKLVRRMKHTYPRAIELVRRGVVDVAQIATHLFPLDAIGRAFAVVDGYNDGVLRAVIQLGE
ncbi:MAG: alcohol dehydrogenase catalytic domain-containing protein [Anaerolineae bacterium]|nr:alcohol dehydrogenase catalytic domain-containing protein [Anaerolineae bacterium]